MNILRDTLIHPYLQIYPIISLVFILLEFEILRDKNPSNLNSLFISRIIIPPIYHLLISFYIHINIIFSFYFNIHQYLSVFFLSNNISFFLFSQKRAYYYSPPLTKILSLKLHAYISKTPFHGEIFRKRKSPTSNSNSGYFNLHIISCGRIFCLDTFCIVYTWWQSLSFTLICNLVCLDLFRLTS